MNEENKKTEVTENKKEVSKTEVNKTRKFDKKRPRNNNRPSKPKSDLEDKVIEIRGVTKVVKGGRQFRFAATVVVGNRKGLVGLGTGKAHEMTDAFKKATQAASKNLIKVDLVDNRTISHDIIVKEGACKVMLKPAKEGTGLVAGGAARAILELAGVKDVVSKSLGSNTKVNVAKATLEELKAQRTKEHVAELRGKKVEEL